MPGWVVVAYYTCKILYAVAAPITLAGVTFFSLLQYTKKISRKVREARYRGHRHTTVCVRDRLLVCVCTWGTMFVADHGVVVYVWDLSFFRGDFPGWATSP